MKLIIAVAVCAFVGLGVTFFQIHKHEPRLRAECEARGGMLISTRTELYACVGKPPAAK